MEMGTGNDYDNNIGYISTSLTWIKGLSDKMKDKVIEFVNMTIKLATDDIRRVIHSIKVGLALTIVSLFYYFQALYDSFGVSAMWAVMTVVVVFEFSVGATIGKGLNRALATFAAGALGVAAHHLAVKSGNTGEPILLGIFVFLLAASTTFARFFPKVKARYDYGMLIFILTFCLVSVSGFRNDDILELAHKRLSTILIGGSTCLIVSICVCPVWAGEDLQNLVSLNIEKLASFLEGFGEEYFKISEKETTPKGEKAFLTGYKMVLNSKSNEETLANFAKWEPGHGRFMYRHPWKQYLIVGSLTRECAYRIDALNGHLSSHLQMHTEVGGKLEDLCTNISLESAKAMKELASAIKTMTMPSSSTSHITNLKEATENLQCLLKSELWKDVQFLQVIPVVTVTSILTEIVVCVEKIANSVHELAMTAKFKNKVVGPKLNNITKEKCKAESSKVGILPDHEVVVTVKD
ncbi:Aluminum-activated malate transporter [Heracleum sosnowskyi]|uniref:Aluminum-activated malate transporter n=1 Tax=Heracleum sosnowskyi TaxID=360622 RepID=A0AAD8IYL9_9APIA|nr:Aluminum-activated malate transporter [Heracleum sosnowskyi]